MDRCDSAPSDKLRCSLSTAAKDASKNIDNFTKTIKLGHNNLHRLPTHVGVGLGGRGGGETAALNQGGGGWGQLLTLQGGDKKILSGGIEGGTRTKFSSNFIKQQKNEFYRKILNFSAAYVTI